MSGAVLVFGGKVIGIYTGGNADFELNSEDDFFTFPFSTDTTTASVYSEITIEQHQQYQFRTQLNDFAFSLTKTLLRYETCSVLVPAFFIINLLNDINYHVCISYDQNFAKIYNNNIINNYYIFLQSFGYIMKCINEN
jgi:hypothetical protein